MPGLSDNFPTAQLHHTLVDFIDSENQYDPSDFLDAISAHRAKLLDPDPFGRKQRNATDRQTLSTQPTPDSAGLPKDLKLTQESFNAIIGLSDGLDLNELECAHKWHQATKKDIIAQVSQLSGRGFAELEANPGETARYVFFMERAKLLSASTQLFKARYYGGHMHPDKYVIIMEQTNALLRDGMAMKFMDRMAKGVAELKQATVPKELKEFMISSMQTMSETLFFMFYQTQITSAESVALTQLILEISSCQLDETFTEWLPATLKVLMVLQLAQIRALNQVQELFSRDIDSAPYSTGAVGNNLPTPLGSKDFMDEKWPCAMARGLSCLGYAILRQPAVEASTLPSSEVLWFLRQSSVCRAFTYIRCCMLPILHAMHTDPNQQLYLSVLSDLVYNSLTLFTQSNYHATGFPYPVSQASYMQDDRWRPVVEVGSETPPLRLPRDTQEDTADCITALCSAYPPFAVRFWSTSSNTDDEDVGNMSSMLNSTARSLDTMHHHPFIGRGVDGILQDSTLIVPIFRMLAAVAHGAAALVPSLSSKVVVGAETNIGTIPHSGQACALATYNLIKHKHPNRLDWAYLFHIVESYSQSLLTQRNSAAKKADAVTSSTGASKQSSPKLLPKDVDALCAIMELIGAVTHEPSVMHSFVSNGYSPIRRLFGLLAAPVPCRLKGKIYQALSVVCKGGHEFAHEIWDCLESYDVLSLMPTRDISSNFYGVRYELEAVESGDGSYPATEGFLCLLEALLTHHKIPEAIGLGYRLPGITGYLDFVVDEVLLKAPQRSYVVMNSTGLLDISAVEGANRTVTGEGANSVSSGQRWAIAAHCIKILGAVIQQYPINELSDSESSREVLWHFSRMKNHCEVAKTWTPEEVAEYSADFAEVAREYTIEHTVSSPSLTSAHGAPVTQVQHEVSTWPRPKSSGFVVMSRLLDSYGAILNCLMSILRENSSLALDEAFNKQLQDRSVDALHALVIAATECNVERAPAASAGHHGRSHGHWGDSSTHHISAITAASTHVFDYGLLSMSPACTDTLFWREKCVNATIGLLYECALREKRFMQCIVSAPPLTIMRTVSGRPVVQELHLCDMFVSLASYQSRSPHSVIAHYIRYSPVASRQVVVMPTVPVMAVRILELGSPPGSATEIRLLKSNEVFDEPANFIGSRDMYSCGVGFTRACALALRDPSDNISGQSTDPIAMSIAKHGVAPPSDVVPIGAGSGGCKHDLFTLTLSDASNYSSSANVDVEVLAKVSEEPSSQQTFFDNSDETEALMGYMSAQGAILDFLLRGLNKNRYGVAHRLLGFIESYKKSGGSVELALRAGVNVTGASETADSTDSCLLAALDVLDNMPLRLRHDEESALLATDSDEATMNCSLQSYDIANKCMELIYHLSSNPLTSDVVLELLRQRLVRQVESSQSGNSADKQRIHSFYTSQLELCLFWAANPCINGRKEPTAAQTVVHTCRLNYVAWFLKVLALELHTSEIRQESNVSTRQIMKLLSNLFGQGPNTQGSDMLHLYGLGNIPGSQLPITELVSLLSPSLSVPAAVDSPDVMSAFTTCSRPYFIGVVAGFEALSSRPTDGAGSVFSLISLQQIKSVLQGALAEGADNVLDTSSVESDIQRKISEAVDIAASYNRYTVLMASSSHLCNAWRQVVDVSLLGWGKLLLPLHSDADTSNERLPACLTSSILIDDLMLPIIRLLSQRTDLEMVSAEPLTRSLLSMTAFLRELCALRIKSGFKPSGQGHNDTDRRWDTPSALADNSGGAILSESQHEAIISGIIQAILRRGNNNIPRINGSVMYRSFLYSALVHLLRMMTVDSCLGADELSGAEESYARAYEVAQAEYRVRNMVILEPYSSVLAEILIRDAVSPNSALCWKLTSVASIGTLLSVLLASSLSNTPDDISDGDVDGSHNSSKRSRPFFTNHTTGYNQILQQLSSKGHLHDIFHYGLSNGSGQSTLDMGLYRATLEMCVPIACNAEGVSVLLDNKLMQFINDLRPIDPVPMLLDDSMEMSAGDMAAVKQECEDSIDDAMTPVLRLFRAMLSTSPKFVPLLEECTLYLHRNADVVKHLLSLKMKSLKGLTLVKSLVSVISIISAYRGPRGAASGGNGMTTMAVTDIFMLELNSLLKRIGTSPVPGLHQVDKWNPSAGSKHAMWWSAVQPTSEYDFELVSQAVAAPLSLNVATNAVRQTMSNDKSTGLGLNRTWSTYDAMKLLLGHQILEGVANILRSVASESAQHGFKDFDLSTMAEVFNCCAELNLSKSYAGERVGQLNLSGAHPSARSRDAMKPGHTDNENWLTSTKSVMFQRENSATTGFGLASVASLAARAAGLPPTERSDDFRKAVVEEKKPKAVVEVQPEIANRGVASIDRTFSFVTENLICAIYAVSLTKSPKELAMVSGELQGSLKYCEKFPPHSFISEVGRWLGKAI